MPEEPQLKNDLFIFEMIYFINLQCSSYLLLVISYFTSQPNLEKLNYNKVCQVIGINNQG